MRKLLTLLLALPAALGASAQNCSSTITASGPTTFCSGGTLTLAGPAGNAWAQKADFTDKRTRAVTFSIGGKGYVATGLDNTNSTRRKDCWEFDPATNTWTQKADFGGTARHGAAGFTIGNKGYLGTGYDGGDRNDFWEFDPAANTWTQKANFGGGVRELGVGFAVGGKGYMGCGYMGGHVRDIWEYDPVTDAWTRKADFGGVGRFDAVSFSLGSKGYIGTGQSQAGAALSDMWEFNPLANTWTAKASLATGRFGASAFVLGSKVYIGTGYNNNFLGDMWEFDPAANTYTARATYGGAARYLAFAFSAAGKGFIGGGGGSGAYRTDFFQYTPPYSYSWSNGATTSSITVTTSGNYTLAITDATGCSATSATTSVTVNPAPAAPVVTASGATSFCAGGSVTLMAATSDLPAPSLVWSNGALTSSVTANTSGDYWATATNSFGCSTRSNTISVFVNPLPATPAVVVGGPTTFCGGGSVTLTGPSSWTQRASFGGGPRSNATTFTVGSKGYLVAGINEGTTQVKKDCWEYDPSTNVWTQKADFGGVARHVAAGFAIGTKGYVGTGFAFSNGGDQADFWEFDPSLNTWTRKADFGGGTREWAIGFSIGSKGYMGMGYSQGARKDIWEYNPATDAWTRMADFAGTGRWEASVFVVNNKAFVGAGQNGAPLGDFWAFDPQANSWTQRASLGNRYGAPAFALNGKGYVATGFNGSSLINEVWEYNVAGNAWTQKGNFAGPVRYHACAFAIGNKAYLGMGATYNGNATDLWEYIPAATYSWTPGGAATSAINATASGNYSVTLSDGMCSASSTPVLVTVRPMPVVNTVSKRIVCNGGTINTISFSGSPAGVVFNWTNNNTSIGLAGSGTGTIMPFTAINNGNTPVTATITVTPSANGCTGVPMIFTITVNPTPNATISYNGAPFFAGNGSVPVNLVGTPGGVYSVTPAGLTVNSGSGTLNLAASVAGTYTITYALAASGSCSAYSTNTQVTVQPAVSATLVYPGTPFCASSGTIVPVATDISGGSFSAVPAGLSIDPTTGIIDLGLSQTGIYMVSVTDGTISTSTQVVIRTPAVNTVSNQEWCSGSAVPAVTFTGSAESFTWTNSNNSIGLAASGSGDLPMFIASNSGTTVQEAIITVSGVGTACTAKPTSFRIRVKPAPVMSAVGNQVLCTGAPTSAVVFASNVSGTNFLWSNNNSSIGMAASGAGDLPSFISQNNSGGASNTATFTVTPFAGGCYGAVQSFSITANRSIITISYPQPAYCPTGSAAPTRTGSSGGVYSATPAGLSIDAITGIINLGASAAGTYTVRYDVTPAAGCPGWATTNIQVRTTATATPIPNQVYCPGVTTSPLAFVGTASLYSWTNDLPSIGLGASGSGTGLPSFVTANSTGATVIANVRVTPMGDGTTSCTGKTMVFRFIINPCPPVTVATGTGEAAARLRADLSLNPNPVVSDQLRVAYSGTSKRLSVEIRDERGVVLVKGLQLSGSNTTLLVGNLRPGSYYVVATDMERGAQASLPFVKL